MGIKTHMTFHLTKRVPFALQLFGKYYPLRFLFSFKLIGGQENDDDVEVVEEIKNPGKAKKEPWSTDEEVALAKAWVHISTCPKVGNEQKSASFWRKILEHFTITMENTNRTHHSLNTKWKNMNTEVNTFNGLWIQSSWRYGGAVASRHPTSRKPATGHGYQDGNMATRAMFWTKVIWSGVRRYKVGGGDDGGCVLQRESRDGGDKVLGLDMCWATGNWVLVRETTTENPEKSKLMDNFTSLGAKLLIGNIHDHASLVNAIKQVDVVISTVGGELVADQVKLIAAIKEAGNVKRFLPSELTLDVDHVNAIEPVKSVFKGKIAIRRAIEAAKIPHTFVSCNGFAGYFLSTVCQLDIDTPPREKLNIYGDGTPKAVFVKEEDIASVTIKAVDDPRTLNKTLIFRPSGNTVSFNEIVSIWESKIGKTLEKTYVSEEQLVKNIQEAPSFILSIELAIMHCVFINGDLTNFEIEPSFGVEASELYPEYKFTSVDEYFTTLA
ncbi:isoflavone reductase [Artemisia annua]|uniref:Isoflavone reductase n=1 Tax=Artemisia annua TaxID=35608 RepID=A0A2U1PPE2_ARTAN|nr:isoflavone reductase [Artemisia annua]